MPDTKRICGWQGDGRNLRIRRDPRILWGKKIYLVMPRCARLFLFFFFKAVTDDVLCVGSNDDGDSN